MFVGKEMDVTATAEHSHAAPNGAVRSFFSFPDPVNETAVRVTAGGVLVLAALAVGLQSVIVLAILSYGFVARVLAGPRLSPMAQLSVRVIAPRLPTRSVAGPPKRFAQGMGAVVTLTALALTLAGLRTAGFAITGLIVAFAILESVVGFCAGCFIYGQLAARGVIKGVECADCMDIRPRLARQDAIREQV